MRYDDYDVVSTYDRTERSHAPHERSRASVIAASVLDDRDTVVEHEHHHLHHHIDHGSVSNNMALARATPRSSQFAFDEIERDTTRSVSVTRSEPRHKHRHSGTQYARSEVDITVNRSEGRRKSTQYPGTTDWTVVDVPPGTRRITIDTTGEFRQPSPPPQEREEISITKYNGVRRSKGVSSELWTEITKDLVCREAIEDMGLSFEETDFFYYVFEYLHKDQINELIELSAAIRRERAKELEYNHIAHSHHHHHHHEREDNGPRYVHARPALPPPQEERPEIIYTEESTRRRSRKYYH